MSALRRNRRPFCVLGLMSGTSADGVDCAIVNVFEEKSPTAYEIGAHGTIPYPRAFRERVLELPQSGAEEICEMNVEIARVFAASARRFLEEHKFKLDGINLVASHGQTIYHIPPGTRRRTPSTLQLGDLSTLAEALGLPVVGEFRQRDMAVGGQGAPIVAYPDWVWFGQSEKRRAILNIGGIANATILSKNLEEVIAFDTGPGNALIDECIARLTHGKKRFDAGGKTAASGRVDPAFLADLLKHPYFKKRPPKTTGREVFGAELLGNLFRRKKKLSGEDMIATLTALTAESIARALRRFELQEVIVSGGGVHNPVMIKLLREAMAPVPLFTSGEFGIPVDGKEASAMAILGYTAYRGEPNNVPSATGAQKSVVMGVLAR